MIWFDKTVMVWSAITGLPEIGNGASGIKPDSFIYMRKEMRGFPDATSVTYLRSHHFRSVVVVKDVPPAPQEKPDRSPAPSLGLRRIDMGDSVLYLIESHPRA
jgi:hypothetical protein